MSHWHNLTETPIKWLHFCLNGIYNIFSNFSGVSWHPVFCGFEAKYMLKTGKPYNFWLNRSTPKWKIVPFLFWWGYEFRLNTRNVAERYWITPDILMSKADVYIISHVLSWYHSTVSLFFCFVFKINHYWYVMIIIDSFFSLCFMS